MTEQTEAMFGTNEPRYFGMAYQISEDLIAEAVDDHGVCDALITAMAARMERDIRRGVNAYANTDTAAPHLTEQS